MKRCEKVRRRTLNTPEHYRAAGWMRRGAHPAPYLQALRLREGKDSVAILRIPPNLQLIDELPGVARSLRLSASASSMGLFPNAARSEESDRLTRQFVG
jgi:hypothetical protein